MNKILNSLCAWMLCIVFGLSLATAQEISGFSTISFHYTCVRNCPRNPPCALNCPTPIYQYEASPYMDTEEDYTASLYYNVQSASALYFGGSQTALETASVEGNPSASAVYNYDGGGGFIIASRAAQPALTGPPDYVDSVSPGVYTEVTDHILDFFYVTSAGAYYDPYGFSISESDGDYDSGYWFSVYVYDTYVQEASIIIGESYDSQNDTENANIEGPSVTTVEYQGFIPNDYVPGPGLPGCPSDVYAGDNRTFDPYSGSYRAMQTIDVGIGGLTSVTSSTGYIPGEATGWSYEFSSAVLQNGQIPDSAYNLGYIGGCTTQYLNEFGHATTANMPLPSVSYSGSNQTNVTLSGSAKDPVPLYAFAFDWDVSLSLSEPTSTDLKASGVLIGDCFPAHEVSVGSTDVTTWMPTSSSFTYIAACLAGFGEINQPFSADIQLIPGVSSI